MYTREEASQVRRNFWTSFGQYMKPIRSAEGETVNWLNYKTGVRHLYFRMDAEKKMSSVAIEISHPDADQRAFYYNQLSAMKTMLETETAEPWNWEPDVYDEDGRQISRIIIRLPDVNVYNNAHWPQIISFLKPRIIALDRFWATARDLLT